MDIKYLKNQELNDSIALIVGTRPGIIMFSPIIRACQNKGVNFFVIHTGQHYSPNMDNLIFRDLGLPHPKHRIEGVAEKKLHGSQTAAMLEGIEKILIHEKPSMMLVGGDANTNLAGALAARKLHIILGHIEAGERSYDWRMPEEHNRRMIDHISDLLFATNEKGARHLYDEKIMGEVFITGNTIVDAAIQNFDIAISKSNILKKNKLIKNEYAVLTSHREENVDNPDRLEGIIKGIERVTLSLGLKVFFAAHPRTLNRIAQFKLNERIRSIKKIIIQDAPSYLDFLALIGNSRIIMTDSGGVQQEACIFKKPCVTLRGNSEWTETLEIGANLLVDTDPSSILEGTRKMLQKKPDWKTPFGDGNAANRIIDICIKSLRRG